MNLDRTFYGGIHTHRPCQPNRSFALLPTLEAPALVFLLNLSTFSMHFALSVLLYLLLLLLTPRHARAARRRMGAQSSGSGFILMLWKKVGLAWYGDLSTFSTASLYSAHSSKPKSQ